MKTEHFAKNKCEKKKNTDIFHKKQNFSESNML